MFETVHVVSTTIFFLIGLFVGWLIFAQSRREEKEESKAIQALEKLQKLYLQDITELELRLAEKEQKLKEVRSNENKA